MMQCIDDEGLEAYNRNRIDDSVRWNDIVRAAL